MGVQENGNNKKQCEKMGSDAAEDEIVLTNNLQHRKAKDEGDIINNICDNARKYVFACAIFSSLNYVLLGYGFEDNRDATRVLVGILSIISLLGSLAGGKTSDAFGRKWTIALAGIVFQSGAVIMSLAPSFQILMIWRILAGIGIGFEVMIAPVYIAEISPSIARGSLTSFPEIFLNLGILLGYVSNYAFSGLSAHINWRIMLGVEILPSIFIEFALFVIPESPRWLIMQNRIEETRYVLSKTFDIEREVEEKLVEIQVAAGIANAEKYEAKAVWLTIIFKDAGIKGNAQLLATTVAIGFTKTMFILIAIFLIDKLGRKPLLYISIVWMTFSLFCLSVILTFFGDGQFGIVLAILFVCTNVAFFSVGIGLICWVLSSKIFPLRLGAQASGLGAVGNRVSSGLICMSFLSMSRAITVGGTFFVFFIISALYVAFVHKCVPETKGKSREEIEMLFQNDGEWQGREVEMGDAERLVQKL
ncbi:hypothetical protein DITRI_Ditri02bG0028900 [Diplodiscus trichospermus]